MNIANRSSNTSTSPARDTYKSRGLLWLVVLPFDTADHLRVDVYPSSGQYILPLVALMRLVIHPCNGARRALLSVSFIEKCASVTYIPRQFKTTTVESNPTTDSSCTVLHRILGAGPYSACRWIGKGRRTSPCDDQKGKQNQNMI